ncbi:SARP family transcriptional regulator [Amycolatopsis albispora]|uniref:SARP family transcriptional regulator n=1 Tax=Amycolatopsis albispora TaxID=1804986 RepID=A0A344LM29_9PSEU|nr:SARP family transcriptional regulator [Amycolatopsis albispora]
MCGRVLPLGGPKPRLLLATLLLQPNVAVSADALIDVLWPEKAPRSAAANIRTYVHALRRRLAEASPDVAERIQSRSAGYILTADADELDATRFQELAARAQKLPPEQALALLTEADELWRGEVLEDLPHSHTWGSTVARLDELRLSTQEQRLKTRVELGQHTDAVVELRGLLADHPLREELWEQLIIALDADGRTAEAFQAYAQVEQILMDELDTEPGPRLQALHTRLLAAKRHGARSGARPVAPSPFPICQLPLDLPDFTGRTEVVDELVGLLRQQRASSAPTVVVLSGAPGVGKSSIAVRVAHELRAEFPDGQLHLDLGGTSPSPRAPMDVLPEILRSLGVPDPAMPRTLAERSALLRSRLSRRRMCLVLDDAGSAAQLRPLLPGAGACAVLVTSRLRLPDLAGARPIDVDVLPDEDAVRLLAGIIGGDRVQAEPDSAAAIIKACGYLPLAIRIVGAKLTHRPSWTLRMLADRLRNERRRLDELRVGDLAVHASVTLSYDMLPRGAAQAFRGLGLLGPVVFPSWAVAAVLDREDADEVLDVLVDAHLVELVSSDGNGQPHYRLHDLLRVYAARQGEIDDSEADRRAVVRRVLEGYLALATSAVAMMPLHVFGLYAVDGPGGWRVPDTDAVLGDPLAWFDAERRTGVAAVALAAEWGLDDLAWRLTAAFTPYFDIRGHQADWQHTHAIAFAAARRTGDLLGQAIVQRNLGQIHLYQDAYEEAVAGFEESYRLFRQIPDDRGAAIALAGLGSALRISGNREQALDRSVDALRLFQRAGDPHGEAVAKIAIGACWLAVDAFDEAERWFGEAYDLSALIGDRHREAHALKRIAMLHQRRGNLTEAREQVNRSIAIFEELGDDHCVGYANQNLGELCLQSGDLAYAQLLLVNSFSVHRRNGDRRSEAEVTDLLGRLHQALGQPERSRGYYERSLAIWRELSAESEAAAVSARMDELPAGTSLPPRRKRRHIASA